MTADIAALYTDYHAAIYNFIRRRVQQPGTSLELAEDLTQETFRRAFESMRRGTVVACPNGWLHQIARNLIVDFYRWRDVRGEIVALDDLEYEPARELCPYDQVASAIGCEHIWRAVERLTDGQARAIGYMAEGYRSADLSDLLGLSDSGGKQLLRRGRIHLRQVFEARGYEP